MSLFTSSIIEELKPLLSRFPEALRIAIRLNDAQLAEEVLSSCEDEDIKKQLAFMVARHGALNLTSEDEALTEILGNTHLSGHFLSLARDLDVFEV